MISSIGKLLGANKGENSTQQQQQQQATSPGGNVLSKSSIANDSFIVDSDGNDAGAAAAGSEERVEEFFTAIQEQNTETVRRLLVDHRSLLTRARCKAKAAGYPPEVERDAFTLLGAFLGPLTGLQLAILMGRDSVAHDILDSTFEQDVDAKFGNGNTALHLAVLLGASGMVSALVERGADVTIKNKRGYSGV
ncbi:hypothetical protein BG004_000047, partial [Podila humilis]